VDVGAVLLAFDLVGLLRGGVVVDAVEDDLGAVLAGGVDLRDGRVLRHDDGRIDARPCRRERDALCVVAGAGGDDAAVAFGVGQLGDLVRRAANLERAGALEVLQFQVDVGTGPLRERVGVFEGGLPGGLRDDVAGRFHVGELEHTHGYSWLNGRPSGPPEPSSAVVGQRGRSVCIRLGEWDHHKTPPCGVKV
jgi:hypothetical protein